MTHDNAHSADEDSSVADRLAQEIRRLRKEAGLSQSELATRIGYSPQYVSLAERASKGLPSAAVVHAMDNALDADGSLIALSDQARAEQRARRNVAGNTDEPLSGKWWACWQTWNKGREILNLHQIQMRQQGDSIDVIATTRGSQEFDEGSYLWRGELRLWDNEILMGWYVADEAAVRSKGTLFLVIHQHGRHMTGRWVGLSYDGPIVTGWGAIGKTEDEVSALVADLKARGAPDLASAIRMP